MKLLFKCIRNVFPVLGAGQIRLDVKQQEGLAQILEHVKGLPAQILDFLIGAVVIHPVLIHLHPVLSRICMDASSCTEAEQIAGLLNQRRRNKTKAAQLLNMSRSTLWRKIKKYGLEW